MRAAGFVAVAGCLSVAGSVLSAEIDARCRAYDRTVTEKVKAILDREDMKATTHAYAAVQRLTSARMLCAEAKTDAALSTYEQLRRMLDRNPPVRNAP